MVYFNITLYHEGFFGYVDGAMRYIGQVLTIEDNDSDFWSVFEALEQLRRLGHEDGDVAAMWYKDPAVHDYSIGLRMFLDNFDALEMVRIGVERGHVELFVVHKDAPEEGFPEIGYLDVGGDPPAENDDAGGEVGPNEEHVEARDGNNEENGQNVLPAAVDNGGNGQVDEAADVEVEVGGNGQDDEAPDVEVGVGGNGQDEQAAAVEVGVVGQMEEGAVDAGAANGEDGKVAVGGEVATAVSNEEGHGEEGLENMVNEGEVAQDMGPNHEREAVFCDLGGRAGSREAESNKEGHQDDHDEDVIRDGGGEMNVGADSDEDSDDAEYVPSAEEVDSAEDIHFHPNIPTNIATFSLHSQTLNCVFRDITFLLSLAFSGSSPPCSMSAQEKKSQCA
ncbi:hypothetical protein PIB30_063822 [Stylosanthes scabra]|uniref:PB1-like domain-containing protein n=1 Tax=Stylosanthes scabra TaxID=79078 RepID=A0ABU6QM76_9FABA|nr:hypothetical protein [Stylosanthes scabra]